jgi:hypothetical protein
MPPDTLSGTEDSFGKKRSVNLNILQSEKEVMLIDPAHRKTLLKTLSVKQTFLDKWSDQPEMSNDTSHCTHVHYGSSVHAGRGIPFSCHEESSGVLGEYYSDCVPVGVDPASSTLSE